MSELGIFWMVRRRGGDDEAWDHVLDQATAERFSPEYFEVVRCQEGDGPAGVALTRNEMQHLLTRCTESTNTPKVNGYSCETCRAIGDKLKAALDATPSLASEAERLTLKVVVSGASFEVGVNRQQPASTLIEGALVGAGIARRDDFGTWQLRTVDGALLDADSLLDVPDGAVLFLDPEVGGGAASGDVTAALNRAAGRLERIRDLDEQTSDGALGSLVRLALDDVAEIRAALPKPNPHTAISIEDGYR